MEHFKIACQPFYFDREDIFTGKIERKCNEEDGIEQDKALLHMVSLYIKQSAKHIAEQEAKDARETKRLKQLELKVSDEAEADDVILVDNDDWEDMPKVKDEFDLNDELFVMQDMQCYELYRKRCKKGKKKQGEKADLIRDGDRNQLEYLEKQLLRLRKKEENLVSRKTVAKIPTGLDQSPFGNRPATSTQNMGMNIRTRVKQQ